MSHSNHSFFPPQHLISPSSSSNFGCLSFLRGYASSHLDTLPKILNHVLYLSATTQICLLFTSFSASTYLNQELMGGFSPVLCTFYLLGVTVLVYGITNHHQLCSSNNAVVNMLEPTEFTLGLSAGIIIGGMVVAILMAQTFQTGGVLCDSSTASATDHSTSNSATANTNTTDESHHAINSPVLIDPVLYEACANHRSNMSSISFWSGLTAWLSAITAILITVGKNDILMARHYDRMNTEGVDSFEEMYRRQQRDILGAQQANALQNRAASLFVGDYSSVPEVTQGKTNSSGPSVSESSSLR